MCLISFSVYGDVEIMSKRSSKSIGMLRLVVGTADARDAVGRDDEDGREVRLERTVEVGEALDVEHVDLSQGHTRV